MNAARRRDLIRTHKAQKVRAGAFVVRCAASDEAWVSPSPNLDAQRNGLWFSLRLGGHPNSALQAAWRTHGEDAFSFEILEVLDDEDMTPLGRADALKTLASAWRARLNARPAFG